MRLVTTERDGRLRAGILVGDDAMIDINEVDPTLSENLVDLIGDRRAMERLSETRRMRAEAIPLDTVRLRSPIPRPPKIIAIGANYADHAAESGQPIPEYPEVFAKFPSSVIGPEEPIVLPQASDEVDYEAELGVVIGVGGRWIAEADALSHVAGFVPVHDVSARDFQFRGTQWTLAKSFDTFCPMGPALVTVDEVPDPHDLAIKTRVNGETLQDSSTSELIFRIPYLVSELSSFMTLEPGDIISTGTPPGVGMGRDPKRYLRPGDVVEIEIEHVGILRNPVVGS